VREPGDASERGRISCLNQAPILDHDTVYRRDLERRFLGRQMPVEWRRMAEGVSTTVYRISAANERFSSAFSRKQARHLRQKCEHISLLYSLGAAFRKSSPRGIRPGTWPIADAHNGDSWPTPLSADGYG
jgi:hypothetical protein